MEDKTEQMKAKGQALDEMIDSGVLTDYTSNKNDIEGELEKMTVKSSVDQELAKLKTERDRNKKITQTKEEQQHEEGQESEVKEEQEEQQQQEK